MSKRTSRKRHQQAITKAPPAPGGTSAIQAQPPAPKLPLLPDRPKGSGPWRLAALVALGVLLPLGAVLAVVWADRQRPPAEGGASAPAGPAKAARKVPRSPWEELHALLLQGGKGRQARKAPRPVWKPSSEADRVVDRFVRLRQANSPDALLLLGLGKDLAVPGRVLTVAEAEALSAEFFLRSGSLRILDVCSGEPDGDGGQVERPGRYTLITRGAASTPYYRVAADGSAKREQSHISNPDIIVEVRGGKVFALRGQLHEGP
jgi:hypothetical protein